MRFRCSPGVSLRCCATTHAPTVVYAASGSSLCCCCCCCCCCCFCCGSSGMLPPPLQDVLDTTGFQQNYLECIFLVSWKFCCDSSWHNGTGVVAGDREHVPPMLDVFLVFKRADCPVSRSIPKKSGAVLHLQASHFRKDDQRHTRDTLTRLWIRVPCCRYYHCDAFCSAVCAANTNRWPLPRAHHNHSRTSTDLLLADQKRI